MLFTGPNHRESSRPSSRFERRAAQMKKKQWKPYKLSTVANPPRIFPSSITLALIVLHAVYQVFSFLIIQTLFFFLPNMFLCFELKYFFKKNMFLGKFCIT
ncbi:hypothetical protein Bca4012_069592 [Brassica carinata]|uniref:(rape) hypothetical protein n=1 Tax=Brassica napus TaxID=3708 RepID=A0A816KV11_BRANA|nr:unnamed protein product [Brassica napus]